MSKQLLEAILDGQLYLVAEYRASHVGRREFVDKTDGKAKGKLTCRHLIEVSGKHGAESITLFQVVPMEIEKPEQVEMPPVEKGKRYAFPLRSLQKEMGKATAFLESGRPVIPLG